MKSARPKLLMITIELPYPPTSGGRMKSWNMLKYFADTYDVGLACPIRYGNECIDEMSQQVELSHFLYDTVEIPRSSKNLLISYALGMPLNVYRDRSSRLKSEIAAVADQYDMILVDHYESGQYVPDNYHGKVVFHAHNATFLMWERYAASDASWPYRLVTWAEGKRVKSSEKQLCERADIVFASPNDIDTLAGIGVPREKCNETYHLGDDSQLTLPSLCFEDSHPVLLYVGTLNWEANVDGLLWFFDEVLPLVLNKDPGVLVKIVGGKPDQRLLDKAQHIPQVTFTGFVKDLEPLFKEARVSIAPLRFGSGIKVKVLNSMCRGLPIVTTSIGAEGIDAHHMKELAIADTAATMAQAIDTLLTDRAAWEKLEQGSRSKVREKYTWKKVLGSMTEKLNECIS
jgi:glycosyltransferase involved in cell wall biosynthesis